MLQDGLIVSFERVESGIEKKSTEISFLGHLKTELVGKHFVSLFPEGESKTLYQCLFSQAARFNQYQEQLLKSTTLELFDKTSNEKVSMSATFTEIGAGSSKMLICFLEKVSESEHVTITTDKQGNILSCSSNIEHIFGYSMQELAHSTHINALLPYFEPLQEQHLTSKTLNVTAKHKTGTMFYVGLQFNTMHIAQIELNNLRITKIDSSLECLLILSECNTILSCSRNCMPLFGFEPSELLGKSVTSLIIPSAKKRRREVPEQTKSSSEEVQEQPSKRSRSDTEGTSQRMYPPSSTDSMQPKEESEEEEPQLSITPFRTERESLKHHDGTLIPINMECIPLEPDSFLHRNNADDSETEEDPSKPFFALRIRRVELSTYWQNRKRVGDYYLLEVVGQGSFGKVRRAIHHSTKQQVAIKILPRTGESAVDMQRALREIDILMKLSHPSIISLHQVIHHKDKLFIVMDYVHGTDLMSYIQSNNGLSEKEAQRCFRQIVSALQYCHARGVIHRDVKPKNILVDMQGNLKLIDFGMSNWIEEGKLRSTFCGTPAFASPEIILGIKYTGPQVDVWSTGVVLYLMVTGRYPFENVAEVLASNYRNPDDKISPECQELIRSMLVVEPEKRATLAQVTQHPWYTKDMDNGSQIVTTITATISTTTIHKDRIHAALSSGSLHLSSVSTPHTSE